MRDDHPCTSEPALGAFRPPCQVRQDPPLALPASFSLPRLSEVVCLLWVSCFVLCLCTQPLHLHDTESHRQLALVAFGGGDPPPFLNGFFPSPQECPHLGPASLSGSPQPPCHLLLHPSLLPLCPVLKWSHSVPDLGTQVNWQLQIDVSAQEGFLRASCAAAQLGQALGAQQRGRQGQASLTVPRAGGTDRNPETQESCRCGQRVGSSGEPLRKRTTGWPWAYLRVRTFSVELISPQVSLLSQ